MKCYFQVIIISLFCFCCTKDSKISEFETEINLEEIPYLIDTILLSNSNLVFIEKPIIYEDKLILLLKNSETNKGWIDCFDKNSKKLIWTWQEAYDNYGASGFGSISYAYNGVLCISQSNLSYGIDILDGSTKWHDRAVDPGGSFIKGVSDIISNVAHEDPNLDRYLRIAEYDEGEWRNIYEISKSDSLNVSMGTATLFEWNEVKYASFVTGKWSVNPAFEHHWLNLYNLTEDKLEWTSDTIPIQFTLSGIPGNQPVFSDGQILLANDALYSYNIEDGSLEWWQWYGNSFVLSTQPIAEGQTVYANNADGYFIGLDVHTGSEKLRTTTGGSPSRIDYANNKCYMSSVSASDGYGHLMVLDAVNGHKLFDVTSPFYKTFGEAQKWNFDDVVAVDPETELVYAADHKYLLIYRFED